MKAVSILLLVGTFAYAQKDCPTFDPIKCGPEDMQCPGGQDWNNCPMPDFCMLSKGPMGKDGFQCPSLCPTKCGPEEIQCWGGEDDNGCMRLDTCMPMKGGPVDKNGNECPINCPVNCNQSNDLSLLDRTF